MPVPSHRALLVCSALLAIGCDLTGLDGGWTRERGLIVSGSYDPRQTNDQFLRFVINVSDTVPVGVPTRIVVSSFGSGSCTRRAGVDVHEQPGGVRIAPWVQVRPPGTVCTSDLSVFPETVSVRWSVPGPVEVRLVGLVGQSNAQRVDSVTRTIHVR
jgi:hypothetical protein